MCIRDSLNIGFDGVHADAPTISADTSQTFNRSESKVPMGAMFASSIYRRFPEDVKKQSNSFARELVSKQYSRTLQSFNQSLQHQLHRFQQTHPALAFLDWQLSSDSQNIYLAAGFGNYFYESVPSKQNAVNVILHEGQATQWMIERFGGQTVSSYQLETWFQHKNKKKPNVNSDPWSVTFLDRAADFKFYGNNLDIRLGFSNFQSADHTTPPIVVRVVYQVQNNGKNWSLVRDGELEIRGTSKGARQKVLRSVMRQRLNSILPDAIPLQLPTPNSQFVEDLNLRIADIATQGSVLSVALQAN